jgi:hypothetical protein
MKRAIARCAVVPAVCCVVVLLAAGCVTGLHTAATADVQPAGVAVASDAATQLGVEVEGIRLSAAGYMLDFRYRVVAPQRVGPLFDARSRPYLLDEASGARLGVPDTPKLGQLRATGARRVVAGRTYSILFANPGRYVQRGATLSLVMGDARLDGLTVE